MMKNNNETIEQGQMNPVSMELYHSISQHYYLESRLLQNYQYREWLEILVAEDVHYWMPVYEQRLVKDKRPEPTPNDIAVYNDDYSELKQRVERLYTGQVWMEDPRSKIRYLITNIEAFHTTKKDEFLVFSNFCIARHRRQTEHSSHYGGREDIIRRVDSGFQLVKRKIMLDARVIDDKNLYFFA